MAEEDALTIPLAPEWTALLIVDVQNDFCAAGAGAAICQGLSRLLTAARAHGVLRVFVRALYDPPYLSPPFAAVLARLGRLGKVCQEGTLGADYWPPFRPQPEPREIEVVKHRYSAFRGTGLAENLRRYGVQTVVVTGVTTSTCVGSTARDAFFEDFFVVVASDATCDPNPERQCSELAFLDWLFGRVLPSEAIVAAWAATPTGASR
jgi:ureidoacrylate peracid hydrolase